jgi:hypothetical protein
MATPQSLTTDAPTATNNESKPLRTDTTTKSSTTEAPIEYKIVKVKKPDGTIIKVKRRVTPTDSVPAPKVKAPKPQIKTSTEPSPNPTTKPTSLGDSPKKASQLMTVETPNSKVASAEVSQTKDVVQVVDEEKPKSKSRSTKNTSTVNRTYRLFRGVHRLHRNLESISGTFDPTGDVDDIGGDSDGGSDDSFSDSNNSSSDNDHDNHNKAARKSNVASRQKDNESVYTYQEGDSEYQESDDNDDQPRKHEAESGGRAQVTQVMASVKAQDAATAKSAVEINEKEISEENTSSSTKVRRRPHNKLRQRSKFAQIIVWTIMIVFPILFIGKFSLFTTESCQSNIHFSSRHSNCCLERHLCCILQGLCIDRSHQGRRYSLADYLRRDHSSIPEAVRFLQD